MKKYTGTAIQSSVDSGLNAIFSSYKMYGNGDAVWLGAADTASYYGNCNDYNICGYGDLLEDEVLSQTYICSPTIKIRSQNLTSVQQSSACATMGAEETYFHTKLQSGNVPIPGDNNSQLQVNIFDSSTDYGKYAGPIFDISTNNGGMYLEGDPSVAGNIPNFVAYEASYAKPDHYVWNLEHEYVHYLDGRFDLFGNFNTPTEKVVWWAEGVAEYVANQDNNQAAIDTIHDGSTYSLSAVFETTYDGFDQDRIYRWGYLAVRFMFEKHFSEVKAMLAETRNGDWSAYKTRLNTWVANYSDEFTAWTLTVKSDDGGTNPPVNEMPIAMTDGPYSGNVNSVINFMSNGSYDPDGTITTFSWDFGDNTTSDKANPSHAYVAAEKYEVSLSVTDDSGAVTTVTTTADISDITVPGSNLLNGVAINTSGIQDSETFYTMQVPDGATDLNFEMSGGSGDADLYVRFGLAPTQSSYDCRPWKTGNNETCNITDVKAGTYHVMIRGYNSFDTSLKGSYVSTSNMPNACVTQGPQSDTRLQDGTEICLDSGTAWLSIGDVNAHSSIAITTAHGMGNLDLEFSNYSWPNESNVQGTSNNSGNSECIYLTNLSEYWGYIKVTGESEGASLIVDFDTLGCR
jgi:microbial collagenase